MGPTSGSSCLKTKTLVPVPGNMLTTAGGLYGEPERIS